MTAKGNTAARVGAKRRTITLERTYPGAAVEDVWELWTTADGIESWWGPDGFSVKVRSIDLRVGGELRYAMIAQGADQIAFMKKSGMPLVTENQMTFTEIVPHQRLAYRHQADFIPGVEAYEVGHVVELSSTAQGTRLLLTIEAMHDEQWTNMAVAGWEMELGKLARALAARSPK
jgi:uncharacterized protein YndB with AHSA1/START domain